MAFQDFDEISQRRQQERRQKIRRRITIAVTSSIGVLLIVAAAVCTVSYMNNDQDGVSNQKNHSGPTPNPVDRAVRAACQRTDYIQTCESSLLKAVKNGTSVKPMHIVRASFEVASGELEKIVERAKTLKFDTPEKRAAFNDCLTLFDDAKEELNRSISSFDGTNSDNRVSPRTTHDVNNWLSAVLSYQQTCVDGFPEGKEKEAMEKVVKGLRELGSNALAIVSQVVSVLSNEPKRSLLDEDEGFPLWIGRENRRMLKADSNKFIPNATVAKDGSGNFTTVNAALNAIPDKYTGRYVIYIKEGVYDETVIVTKKMVNITMYGDGSQKSIVTGKKNYVDGTPTYQTATFAAIGEGFVAQSLGFRNMAGPEKHQAVALRVQSDRSIFLNCRFEGYQDTLYAQTHRQFYRSCYITGTVDFIFGDAAAVFQNCMIYVRRPMDNQQNTVTAQGRIDRHETTGIVLQNCKVLADKQLESEKARFRSYLGRPWKEYSRTVVMETEIGDLIDPEGWLEWSGGFALGTLYYAEFGNKGDGADTSKRVAWAGYKRIKREEAVKYTVRPFLAGEGWIESSNVPVRFGMFA